jgi:hypothetical protein
MHFPKTIIFRYTYKWIRFSVFGIILLFLANCGSEQGSGQGSGQAVQQILNLEIVSTLITSDDNSLANISVAKITFETIFDYTAFVEINGKIFDAGTGKYHSAFLYDFNDQLEYTIHVTKDNNTIALYSSVIIHNFPSMFIYHGELDSYINYLVPVVIDIYEKFGDSEEVLNILLLGGIDYFNLFKKETIFSMQEKTSIELFESFNRWKLNNTNTLKAAWPFFSENEYEVVSVLNIVSYLWHFGNFERISRPGCVQVNELIKEDFADFLYQEYQGEDPIYWRTAVGMSDYLNSKIGCCTDHAFLTKVLLDEAGFETRRVTIPGHWLTEVLIGSSWYTVDASSGLMVNASTEAMLQGNKRMAYLFFTPYMDFESIDHYASAIYPWLPTLSIGTGIEGGIVDESEVYIILGYYDDPPFKNESEQIEGR